MKRRLIVCADGTWNTPDETSASGKPTPTNVAKLYNAILPVGPDHVEQRAHYERGVGTAPDFWDKWFGGGLGAGLDEHILACYKWLVTEYYLGDDIYLFGFSRGAYTVRSLAGLIRNSGLLRREHIGFADTAFHIYRDRGDSTKPRSKLAESFRREHSYTEYKDAAGNPIDSTPIRCIGVWDTVGALGIPLGVFDHFNTEQFSFHDTELSTRVSYAFHALAIDEKRKPFAPTLWNQPQADADAKANWLEQAWFVGAHSNVGGGCEDARLSDEALLWMASRVSNSPVGLTLDWDYLKKNTGPDPLGALDDPFKGIYVPLGPHVREIDDPASRTPGMLTWEYAHRSAKQRLDGDPNWTADNFKRYHDRPGDIQEFRPA